MSHFDFIIWMSLTPHTVGTLCTYSNTSTAGGWPEVSPLSPLLAKCASYHHSQLRRHHPSTKPVDSWAQL